MRERSDFELGMDEVDMIHDISAEKHGTPTAKQKRDKAWADFIDYQNRKKNWEDGKDFCPEDVEF